MGDDNFEKRMEDWAEREAEAAPEMQPTPEMVRLVETKRGRWTLRFSPPFWSQVGIALVALILLVITYFALYKPDFLSDSTPEALAFAAQREVQSPGGQLRTLEAAPPDQGKGRGSESFQYFDYQVHQGASDQIDSLDLRQEPLHPLTLTTQDSYRLVLKANQEIYLYLYLLSPEEGFQALHRQTGSQPLPAAKRVFLPAKPDWFYMRGGFGGYRLFAITSTNPISELDDLYDQYALAIDPNTAQAARIALQSLILSIKTTTSADVGIWQLRFNFEAMN